MSVDSVETQKKFAEKEHLNFILLADKEKKIARAYHVLIDDTVASRTTFIIDPKCKIAKIFPKVSPKDHSKEIILAIEELRRGSDTAS